MNLTSNHTWQSVEDFCRSMKTIKDLNDEALAVANDPTSNDADYQQAFNALDMSFTSVQAEVSEAREAKDLYAVKVNEVNEWVNGEDGDLLKANEYSTILSAIYHAYDVLNEEYTTQGSQLKQVLAENALLKSGISQGRWEDAKAILTAKGLDITQDNIISELQTHPEWLGNAQVNDMQNQSTKPLSPQMAEQFAQGYPNPQKIEKPSVIRKVGSEVQSIPNDMSEDDQINKWFGLKN